MQLLQQIEDKEARQEADCERAYLGELGGGCSVPVGASAKVSGETLTLTGCIASLDGKELLRERITENIKGNPQKAAEIGLALAKKDVVLPAARKSWTNSDVKHQMWYQPLRPIFLRS